MIFGRYCLGGGCWNVVTDPDHDYCENCFERLRDLVEEAAASLILAAEAYLREDA